MPTTRHRRRPAVREALEPAMREYFWSGDLTAACALAGEGFEGKIQLLTRVLDHPRFWREHGPDLVDEYVATYPGARPWGWWRYDAPAPRRWILDGTAVAVDIPADWIVWRACWGIQFEDQVGRRAVAVESEATYLRRHRLLGRAERARLRPIDFEPECRPDVDDDPAEAEGDREADESPPTEPCRCGRDRPA